MNTRRPLTSQPTRRVKAFSAAAPLGGGLNGAFLAKARKHALAHAECMREHGVPNFPDPTVTGNGNGITERSGGPGINPQSPRVPTSRKDLRWRLTRRTRGHATGYRSAREAAAAPAILLQPSRGCIRIPHERTPAV